MVIENAAGLTLSVKLFSAMRPEPTCGIWDASGTEKSSSAPYRSKEMDKLCTVDEYPSDSILFTAYGYALHIHDELVAAAFASLPEQEQGILILHCVLGLADGEIGSLVGMSRSAVQRHRTKALNELRKRLEEERRKPK